MIFLEGSRYLTPPRAQTGGFFAWALKKNLVLRVNKALIIVLKEMTVLDFVFLYQLTVRAGELIGTYQ